MIFTALYTFFSFFVHKKNKNLQSLIFIFSCLFVYSWDIFLNAESKLFFNSFEDVFADAYKMAFSFNLFDENIVKVFEINQSWYFQNDYNIQISNNPIAFLNSGLPGIIFFGYLIGLLLKFIGINLALFHLILTSAMFVYLYRLFNKNKFDLLFLIVFLISFPTVFMFERGNIQSLIVSTILFLLIQKYVKKIEFSFFDLFLLSIAGALRPSSLIFILLFLKRSFIYDLKKIASLSFVFSFINYSFFLKLQDQVSNYSYQSILKNLEYYRIQNYYSSNYWDSSLYRFMISFKNPKEVSNALQLDDFKIFENIQNLILFFAFLTLLYLYCFIKNFDRYLLINLLVLIYLICVSPLGSYHLMILSYLFVINSDKILTKLNLRFLNYLYLIIIFPKFGYMSIFDFEINTYNFLNISLIIFSFLYLITRSKNQEISEI